MDIGLLVGFCILLAIALGCIPLMHSYHTYTKDRVFTKVKFPIFAVALISLLLACLVTSVTLIALNINTKPNRFMLAYLILSCILLALSIAYLICFILIYVFNNKNKVDYLNIANIDWKQKEADLLAKVGDMEAIKSKLSTKNPKYYTTMLEYYKTIVSRAGENNLPVSEIIADIVTFNDAFTHKWCSKLNVYQLQLTYKFCIIFQKNPGQK